jgi:hypothetical protein
MEAKNTNPAVRENERIIRQSQLERAIELMKLFEIKPTLREVLRLSQILTNFQYDWNLNHYELVKFEKHFNQVTGEKLLDSIPHHSTDKPLDKQAKGPSSLTLAQAKENKGRA